MTAPATQPAYPLLTLRQSTILFAAFVVISGNIIWPIVYLVVPPPNNIGAIIGLFAVMVFSALAIVVHIQFSLGALHGMDAFPWNKGYVVTMIAVWGAIWWLLEFAIGLLRGASPQVATASGVLAAGLLGTVHHLFSDPIARQLLRLPRDH